MFYYIVDDAAFGPYNSVEEAKVHIEDWEVRSRQVIIAQAVEISDTKVTYETTWGKVEWHDQATSTS